jgi:two-component system, chemotaxis family, response regulator Rcp1
VGLVRRKVIVQILLVEDNPADVRLLEEAFKESRIESRLSVVPDGVEALAFLRREGRYSAAPQPDLVVLDLNMPRKDGRQVLTEMKADPQLRIIPVMILSSSSLQEDQRMAATLGAVRYIIKPHDFSQFLQVVRVIEDIVLR